MAKRFDVFNPFEGMHMFVSLYWIRQLLNITKKTPVLFTDKLPEGREFNKHLLSLFATEVNYMRHTVLRFSKDNLIMLPSSGVSLLNYYNNPFRLSPILIDFSHFVTQSIPFQSDRYVVVSKRKPYTRNGILYNPSNWDDVIKTINKVYHSVKVFELASLTMYNILQLIHNAEALVGVHGAGLVWSLFMRQKSKLFEIFGGNRGIGNTLQKNQNM